MNRSAIDGWAVTFFAAGEEIPSAETVELRGYEFRKDTASFDHRRVRRVVLDMPMKTSLHRWASGAGCHLVSNEGTANAVHASATSSNPKAAAVQRGRDRMVRLPTAVESRRENSTTDNAYEGCPRNTMYRCRRASSTAMNDAPTRAK